MENNLTNIGGSVYRNLKRQTIEGNVGGSLYGIVWGELSNMLNSVLGLNISSVDPSFSDKMYGYMFRLMAINKDERDLTLSMITAGAYVDGNPDGLSLTALFPSYADIINDYSAFVRGAEGDELNGVDSTSVNIYNGVNNHIETINLYPDDLGMGTFDTTSNDSYIPSGKWRLGNRNSILDKTKRLFEERKINSLISRFGTKADGELSDIDFNGKIGYGDLGMSRGKNLRKAPGSSTYDPSGYNNPYCRVWTHAQQYDRFSKTIRPFNTEDGEKPINKFHTWNNTAFEFKEGEDGDWGWKHQNSEWSHSVLSQQDGVVNITPKYDENGTIHTKDCMFSIENLAWKDYDPYAFENALSWEQRGPLGGRIMWFPPYGISFTENTNVQWNESTFIGRGEKVYTYTDTTRSGTLSFMMLTDHPSVTDFASWNPENQDKIDDDIWNRFFAGCDSLDGNDEYSLMHYVTPTPKDYIFETKGDTVEQKVNNPEKPKEDTPSESVEEVTFFVFYPNNYSGVYDSSDFAIAYLLGGVNSQKIKDGDANDKGISFNSPKESFVYGYEMWRDGAGISDINQTSPGCIIGNKQEWQYAPTQKEYLYDTSKEWWYRIDGKYEVPSGNEIYKNQYAQKLVSSPSYQDTTNNHLNLSIENINNQKLAPNKNNTYSLAEVAYAIAEKTNAQGIKSYLSGKLDSDRTNKINNLVTLVKNGKLESVQVTGYANSQGYNASNSVNKKRNDNLSKQRGITACNWIMDTLGKNTTIVPNITNHVETVSTDNENADSAKLWRCAKCTLTFSTDSTNTNTSSEEYESINEENVKEISKETGVSYGQIKAELINAGYIDENSDFLYSASDLKYMYDKMNDEKNTTRVTKGTTSGYNKTRYDNEMFFYKKFQRENPFVWKKLTDKLQYFDPAFHSMTPEGFNMRLTFLQQCTRQGDTVSASDPNAQTASNMAFGRPPFCVLRLGDFYNQMIVIRSINIVYDEDGSLMWDLNDEGIGAQPMIAKVTIQFDFIGGSDLAGPVRRLQNAMSFNYYANTSLYDNRADRMYYDAEENLSTKMGGAGNDKPSLPKMGEYGQILDKKGTYSVYNSIQKNTTDEEAKDNKKKKKS